MTTLSNFEREMKEVPNPLSRAGQHRIFTSFDAA